MLNSQEIKNKLKEAEIGVANIKMLLQQNSETIEKLKAEYASWIGEDFTTVEAAQQLLGQLQTEYQAGMIELNQETELLNKEITEALESWS